MKPTRAQRGSVFILTLWLASGLSITAVLASHAAMLRYRREAAQTAGIEAELAVEAVLRMIERLLALHSEPGTMPEPGTYEAADIAIGTCRVWLIGRSVDPNADTPVFALQDEAGRLNLNTATREMLEALPGMPAALAAAIVDWRDEDDDATAGGAESETYLAKHPAYTAKNAPFETVDELRLVHGVEDSLLHGRDRNRNGIVEAWEKDLATARRQRLQDIPDTGFLDLFTVFSREPGSAPDGEPRLDLNGNAPTVRQALIQIFGARGAAIAVAAGVGITRFASVLEFCIRAEITDDEAPAAFARLRVGEPDGARGRVNVNSAPAAVLASLPGIGVDHAATLVSYRNQNPSALATPLWLVRALGPEAATAAGPYVTTASTQVAADIVAVSPRGRTFVRRRFVIDTSSGQPVVVSRRDLTHLGWPLGAALHQELMMPAHLAANTRRTAVQAAPRAGIPGGRESAHAGISHGEHPRKPATTGLKPAERLGLLDSPAPETRAARPERRSVT